jgi:aspartate/methionine/tyrosine aminotransferase
VNFEPIKYMEWVKARKHVKYDLCRSGMADVQLKELGIDLKDLEIGGENFYGFPLLIQAIARRYGVKEENVMPALGTSHALFLVCCALLGGAGDRVLIEKPAYEPLVAVPKAFGAQIGRWERRFSLRYSCALDEFEKVLSKGIKLVLLSNLHNPSGVYLSSETLRTMAEMAREKGIYLVVDEIYLEFLEEETSTSFHLGDNVIAISSLTKVFGLGGLRCGWILAPSHLVKRLKIIHDYNIVEGVFVGEWISARIFDRLDSIRKKHQEHIRHHLEMIRDFMQKEQRFDWVEPEGGAVCFPRILTGSNGDEFADRLVNDFDIAVVPGSFFEDDRHFRLSCAVETDVLSYALEKMSEVLSED